MNSVADPRGPDLSRVGSVNQFIFTGGAWVLLSNDPKFTKQQRELSMNYSGPLAIHTGIKRYYPPEAITLNGIYFTVANPSSSTTTTLYGGSIPIIKSLEAELCLNGVPILGVGLNPFSGPNELLSNKVILNTVVLPTDCLTLNLITVVPGSSDLNAIITYK